MQELRKQSSRIYAVFHVSCHTRVTAGPEYLNWGRCSGGCFWVCVSLMTLSSRASQIELDELVADCRGRQHTQVGKKQSDEWRRCVVNNWMLLVKILCGFQCICFILQNRQTSVNASYIIMASVFTSVWVWMDNFIVEKVCERFSKGSF